MPQGIRLILYLPGRHVDHGKEAKQHLATIMKLLETQTACLAEAGTEDDA